MSKNGISFFPLDVCLDTKFDLIEAEYGLQGFAVVVKLYQRIYGEQGYYCDWTNEVALLFAHRIGLGGGVVSEIVNAAIKRGIFDKELYDKYQILTSKGIQERYFEVVSRRKEVMVDERFLLTSCCKNQKNVYKNDKNVNISCENVDISKQSKVKESKVKESKERKAQARAYDMYDPLAERFFLDHPHILIDTPRINGIDFLELEKKIAESSFLQQQTLLSFSAKNYARIMADGYKDFKKPAPKKDFEERKYTGAEIDDLFQNDYDLN